MSITFTTLIFIEFLNVIQEVTVIQKKIIIAILSSLLLYVTSIYFFNTLFQVSNFDIQFLLKVGIITSVCWLPIWGFKKLVDWYDPNAAMKVRANNS
jgi:hypothetical protein